MGGGIDGSLMGTGRGREGSRMTGTASGDTWREAGGGNGGRVADVVRERGTGLSSAGVGGCSDGVRDGCGVPMATRMVDGGGGGGGIPEEAGIATSGLPPPCFIISIICLTLKPMSWAICIKV